jgi:Uma2 family endonuclease
MIAQPQYISQQDDKLILSPTEYLAWESEQDSKYEYENGRIIAMTGGTIPHSQIPLNFASLLLTHLRGKGCKIAQTNFDQDDPLIHITSIDLQFPLSTLYENIDFLDSEQV